VAKMKALQGVRKKFHEGDSGVEKGARVGIDG